jgi:hypothetical protein
MIEKKFFCNLCREEIKEISKGMGVHFSAIKGIEFLPLPNTNNHLCNDCIDKIVDAQTRTN